MALVLSECPNLQGELLTLVVTSELESATWRPFKDAACGCIPTRLPALSRGSAAWQEITAPEPTPAAHRDEESHCLFLLLYWMVKSDMPLLTPSTWERCLIERFWRKIPEIILQAAFFQTCVSQSWIRGVGSSWPSWLPAFPTQVPVNTNTAMNSSSVWAESNTLPQSQNKQDILWTVADQTLRKHRSPGTQLMPLRMTCLPSVWLLVLISADEDGCNQGSRPRWVSGDIKPEAILHHLMVSTVQFLALKKAKAEKFLDVVSYHFAVRFVSEVRSWAGQNRWSSELLMGQNKDISLLPTQQ